jgi:hypothetical protein
MPIRNIAHFSVPFSGTELGCLSIRRRKKHL